MRITSVSFPQNTENNLGAITMERLGSLIVIAGRNGAGKTRLLKRLEQWRQEKQQENQLLHEEKRHRQSIENQNRTIEAMKAQNMPPEKIQKAFQQLQIPTEALSKVVARLSFIRSVNFDGERTPQFVSFVPDRHTLANPNDMSRNAIRTAAKNVETPGVQHLQQGCLARIQELQNLEWEATHPSSYIAPESREAAAKSYRELSEIIENFLHTKLSRSGEGDAQIFGLPLGKAALSQGQLIVLQLCVAIHAQGAALDDLILVLDEPENHLHPAALLDLIHAIRRSVSTGQLWIATHSLPLLATVDPNAIWWMENETISKGGNRPATVLDGLLGSDERRHELATFLDLPFALASNRFAAECLTPPNVVGHRNSDPQNQQIKEILDRLRQRIGRLRVLDFGAGKGRLVAELAESSGSSDRIDYIAFDPSDKDAEACQASIRRLYQGDRVRYFNDFTTLRSEYDEGSFHVVILCNVLHEIPPSDWGQLFGPKGRITSLLAKIGYALILEVQQLPYGECAHQDGFIVFDTAQLRKLFAIKESDEGSFSKDSAKDGWLNAHLIGSELIERYSSETRSAALRDLETTARDRILPLRSAPRNYRNGRLHGFWVQQFANASLALEHF